MDSAEFAVKLFDLIVPVCKGKNGAFVIDALDCVQIMIQKESYFIPSLDETLATQKGTTQKSV